MHRKIQDYKNPFSAFFLISYINLILKYLKFRYEIYSRVDHAV